MLVVARSYPVGSFHAVFMSYSSGHDALALVIVIGFVVVIKSGLRKKSVACMSVRTKIMPLNVRGIPQGLALKETWLRNARKRHREEMVIPVAFVRMEHEVWRGEEWTLTPISEIL